MRVERDKAMLTSRGLAAKSVDGSRTSSLASCIIRLTATVYHKSQSASIMWGKEGVMKEVAVSLFLHAKTPCN